MKENVICWRHQDDQCHRIFPIQARNLQWYFVSPLMSDRNCADEDFFDMIVSVFGSFENWKINGFFNLNFDCPANYIEFSG